MLALRDHDTAFSLSCTLKSEGPTYGSNTLREHDTAFLLSLKLEGTTKFSLSAYQSWLFSFGRGLVLFETLVKPLCLCTGENSTLISGTATQPGSNDSDIIHRDNPSWRTYKKMVVLDEMQEQATCRAWFDKFLPICLSILLWQRSRSQLHQLWLEKRYFHHSLDLNIISFISHKLVSSLLKLTASSSSNSINCQSTTQMASLNPLVPLFQTPHWKSAQNYTLWLK